MLHDVSLGAVVVQAGSVLGGLQHGHARICEVGGECGFQGPLLCAARGAAAAATSPAADTALLQGARGSVSSYSTMIAGPKILEPG